MCRIEGQHDGKPATLRFQLRLSLKKGPADIYDLGVPKATKLVDRVPAGDLKLVVESLNAGRARMDNYRAVFVEHSDRIDQSWQIKIPDVFYRKEDRYRKGLSRGCTLALMPPQKPGRRRGPSQVVVRACQAAFGSIRLYVQLGQKAATRSADARRSSIPMAPNIR